MTEPPVVVFRREPEASDEIVRFVVLAVPKYPVPETERAVDDAYGKTDATEDVAVNRGAVRSPYVTTLLRKRDEPFTSRMFPVVVVALAPIMTTSLGSVG